ncbi:GIY-YIG nuclease family protein [Fimicolochytrium jonesii]|uniref:GIY-YIG nuclease family protein n=1 Tax=Fimicolochytrium jonesii TaxID=1396493 RepID=UPI0022FED2B0|nr:GIY-YIG nuclease family protein [Fimicolochytrium jonesii]KAI8819197.1 meiotically up-regulated gene 113-domain-containing protein [Fimicolochytrium jonesii]
MWDFLLPSTARSLYSSFTHHPSEDQVDFEVIKTKSSSIQHETTIDSPRKTQCQAYNKTNGNRCTRQSLAVKCHLHRFVSNATDSEQFGRYADFINPTLSDFTKRRLYAELFKPISSKDKPGYIYAYQLIRPEGNTISQYDSTMYKIGRTTDINRRLSEWSSRCGFRPKLIECFPPQLDASNPFHASTASICRFSDRCERLIHIELADRFRAGPIVCPGRCKEAHYEWFKVHQRGEAGEGDGVGDQGWMAMRQIICKWVDFIRREHAMEGERRDADQVGRLASPFIAIKVEDKECVEMLEVGGDDDDDTFYSMSQADNINEELDDFDEELPAYEEPLAALANAFDCMCLLDRAYTTNTHVPATAASTLPNHVPILDFGRTLKKDSAGMLAGSMSTLGEDAWEVIEPILIRTRS